MKIPTDGDAVMREHDAMMAEIFADESREDALLELLADSLECYGELLCDLKKVRATIVPDCAIAALLRRDVGLAD